MSNEVMPDTSSDSWPPPNPIMEAEIACQRRLREPGARRRYPGLEILDKLEPRALARRASARNLIEVCPAQDFVTAALYRGGLDQGTLALTPWYLCFLTKKGTFEGCRFVPVAEIKSVALSPRRQIIERLLGTKTIWFDVSTTHASLRFMVGEGAGQSLQRLVQRLLEYPPREKEVEVGPGSGESVTFYRDPGKYEPRIDYWDEAAVLLENSPEAREVFQKAYNEFLLDIGLPPIDDWDYFLGIWPGAEEAL
ncbi:MAG: hypothetical protein V1912_13215 [bacterium]